MSQDLDAASAVVAPRAGRAGALIATYTAAIGLSAFLLFSVQPMFAKMVLPTLGGSPSVWSVAMVFFQAALLGGYLYAHALTTWVKPTTAAQLHIGFMLVVLAVSLPIGLSPALGDPPAEGATLWLIGLLAISVGLPFVAVSAHGPLLQAWFARTGHPQAHQPYGLYAASNLGSFAALLAFPFLIEPFLPVKAQATAWAFGFGALIAAVAAAAAFLPAGGIAAAAHHRDDATAAPSVRVKATWVGLAFVPSALLVATTAQISTDVAAAPLLWVLPLALFLLTFIITFQPTPWLSHRTMLIWQPGLAVVAVAFPSALAGASIVASVAAVLAALFVTAMVFHGELVRLKPAARHLTGFYLWMSFGGVLGGVFAALIAPQLFSTVFEYGLLFALAVAWRLSDAPRPPARAVLTVGAGLILAALALMAWRDLARLDWSWLSGRLGLGVVGFTAIIMTVAVRSRALAGVGAAVALLALQVALTQGANTQTVRSFFGVSKITVSEDGRLRILGHGTTYHGAQRLDQMQAGVKPDPLKYYYRGGPFHQAIEATRTARGGSLPRVAVIGLGAGSQACLRQDGEAWRFYEIDPDVARIATNPQLFTFLSACAPGADIVLGDARLKLRGAEGGYDLMIIDAFSSDAIPLHLVTREAMALYREKLAPGGAIIFHLSNRHLTLAPFVAATAASIGLNSWRNVPERLSAEQMQAGLAPSELALVTDNAAIADALPTVGGRHAWLAITPAAGGGPQPWTDDFSNLLGAAWKRLNGVH
jgi:hypothetical protein